MSVKEVGGRPTMASWVNVLTGVPQARLPGGEGH